MSANKKLSELDVAGTIDGTELLYLVQNSVSVRAALSALNAYLSSVSLGGPNVAETGIVSVGTWNSAIKKRVSNVAPAISTNVDCDSFDAVTIENLNANTTIENPTGTPTNLQELEYWILDDATPRNLTFESNFAFSSDLTAPAATTSSRRLYLRFQWVELANKWYCVQKLNNFL